MVPPLEYTYNKYRKYISYIFGAIVFALLVGYFYKNQDVLVSLKNISWQPILMIMLMDTMSFLISGLMDQSMINRFDPRVSFLDCYLLGYANNFLNKLLPTIGGGAAFRAVYLKKKYHFPYSQFVSTVGGLYVISFFSASLIAIFYLLFIYAKFKVINWIITLAFFGIFLFCLFIVLVSPQLPETDNRILKVLKSIFEGWNILRKQSKFIFFYAFLTIIFLFFSALQTLIIYQALGATTSIIPMLFLSTLGIIMAFLNFTPDGIGVKEGIYIFSAKLVQIPDDILVLGSLVLRGISICTTLIVGGICYLILVRNLKILEESETRKNL